MVNDGRSPAPSPSVFPTIENGVVKFTVALAEPARHGLRPSLRVDVHVVTDRKAADAARRARPVRRRQLAPQASSCAAIAPSACRSVLGLAGVDYVEIVSGAAEGDELIVSDMRDYLHLEVQIKYVDHSRRGRG